MIFRFIFLNMGNISDKICTVHRNTFFTFITFSSKIVQFIQQSGNYSTAVQATDENMVHPYFTLRT